MTISRNFSKSQIQLQIFSRSSTIGKHHSPPRDLLEAASNAASTSQASFDLKPKTSVALGTSPANFSFLMPPGQDKDDEVINNSDKAVLSRSHSTSIITDIKKTLQVQSQVQDQNTESSEPGSVVSSLKPDQFKSPPKNDANEKNDDKKKYRRCSSLKSGKTPPGTPGNRKIVR